MNFRSLSQVYIHVLLRSNRFPFTYPLLLYSHPVCRLFIVRGKIIVVKLRNLAMVSKNTRNICNYLLIQSISIFHRLLDNYYVYFSSNMRMVQTSIAPLYISSNVYQKRHFENHRISQDQIETNFSD